MTTQPIHFIGRHEVWVEPPGILVTRWHGETSGEEMIGCYELYEKLMPPDAGFYACSLMDEESAPSFAGRKAAASAPQAKRFRAMAFVGAAFRTRVLITMVTKAHGLLSQEKAPQMRFFDDPTEAIEWLKSERARGLESETSQSRPSGQ